jgi:hypothetical protein
MDHLLGVVWAWDPFLKGLTFTLASVVILCGSVYLLLATNLGARLGFLVAGAALFGWIFLMAIVWTVYGIGLKGRPPEWKARQVVTGDIGRSPSRVLSDFPEKPKWRELDPASAQVADAQAAADTVLVERAGFKTAAEYQTFKAYEKGGEKHFLTLFHRPHYLVLEVQPVTVPPAGSTAKPQPDPSRPIVSVVMVRDLGSLRLPSFVVTVATGILFLVFCYALHLRDKALIALRTAPATATT